MADVDWSSPDAALEGIKQLIKAVPDFPKPGILFRYVVHVISPVYTLIFYKNSFYKNIRVKL